MYNCTKLNNVGPRKKVTRILTPREGVSQLFASPYSVSPADSVERVSVVEIAEVDVLHHTHIPGHGRTTTASLAW